MEEITHHGPVVWFVRHAQSVWNEAGIVQGQGLAPGLTEAGKVKAELLAQQLMGCGAGVVLTSDLLRARQTASPIAHRLSVPLVVDPTLRERNLGTAEGRPSSFLLPSTSGHNGEVVVDPDARPAGGESLRQLHARVSVRLEELRLQPPARAMIVVTHGGFLRIARAWLSETPVGSMSWSEEPNAGIWRVDLGALPRKGVS